jgi:hypothetical protein
MRALFMSKRKPSQIPRALERASDAREVFRYLWQACGFRSAKSSTKNRFEAGFRIAPLQNKYHGDRMR